MRLKDKICWRYYINMPYKVLFVDDSKMLRRDMEIKFRSEKFRIITAMDWKEGKKLLKEITPDTLVLDFHLQDNLTAHECLAELETIEHGDIPVILVSSDPSSIKKVYSYHPQVLAYLDKPVKPKELELILESLFAVQKPQVVLLPPKTNRYQRLTTGKTTSSLTKPGVLLNFLQKGFRFIEKIASRGMCKVYKLEQVSLEREVVLKVLLERYCKNPIFSQRFSREAKILASLSHPNLITVYDYGEEKEMQYILMEYINGLTLRNYMRKYELNLETIMKIMFEVSKGLQYLHQKKLVHRDLKPSNIMISEDGEVRIIDFGLAKSTRNIHGSCTILGEVLGTPEYMSPEQTLGFAVDQRSDIYSLGVIFYEILSGRLPFQGDFPEETIYMQRNCEHIPLRKHDRKISQSISNIVDKMLAKLPEHRFQTIEDFINRLQLEKYLQSTKEIRAREYSSEKKLTEN